MNKIQPKTMTYYELSEIMDEMENKGFMKRKAFWREYVIEWGVSNDTVFWLGFNYFSQTKREEDFKEYFEEVNKLLGLPLENNGIHVHVSW
jgi:hypothetical protein